MSQSENIVGLGARTDYLAQVPNADPGRLRLTPEEGRLFAQVGRASRIDEILAKSGLEEARAIALLLSLRAKGAVVPARVTRPAAPVAIDAAMAEDVDLPTERKKEILDLERALDRLDAFELLGLRPGATAEEAKQAWYEASRRYHPDRFFGKNIGSFRVRIDRIFKRLTEAYNTLSDPKKRAAYFAAHPELAAAPKPEAPAPSERTPLDPERAAERRERFARHPYLAKRGRVN
ncbi:MAG: J domain-containing protein, partial [Myxococcaceae bacterium]